MDNKEFQNRLNGMIDEIRARYAVPSLLLSVHRAGETFFCGGGLADIGRGLSADENTVYAIASSTKSFTATALALLCDEGALDLDAPVRRYLPDFEMYDPYMTAHLTARDALSHRTGLPRHDAMWHNARDLPIAEVVRRLRYLPPAFEPRTRMCYQNLMYTLGSLLIERTAGMRWQDFVSARLLRPLGMDRTFPDCADWRGRVPNQAEPYHLVGGRPVRMPFRDMTQLAGCGCLASTVRDLDRWMQFHLGGGVFAGQRLLSARMADQLHRPQMVIRPYEMEDYDFPEIDFTAYGLGFFIESYRGHKLVHHGGTIDGYKSIIGFYPEANVCFSALSNLNADWNQHLAALGYAIGDLAFGLEPIDWVGRFRSFIEDSRRLDAEQERAAERRFRAAPPAAAELADCAGQYEHPAYGTLGVEARDGALTARFFFRELPLIPAEDGAFLLDARAEDKGYIPLRFRRGADGRVDAAEAALETMCAAPVTFAKVSG